MLTNAIKWIVISNKCVKSLTRQCLNYMYLSIYNCLDTWLLRIVKFEMGRWAKITLVKLLKKCMNYEVCLMKDLMHTAEIL